MSESIHIAVDARPLSRNTGGIKRYLKCLLEHMVHVDGFRFTLYSDGKLPQEYTDNKNNVRTRIAPLNTTVNKVLWQFYIQSWLKKDKPDVFWSPRHHIPWSTPNDLPIVVTIHDVIWKTHPQTLETTRLLNEKLSMPRAINRAQKILVPSQATADEIEKHWPTAKNKISVIQHGTTEFPKQLSCKALVKQPYFLAVGTIEPRKNYIRLIQAFDNWCASNKQMDLVIAGQKGWGLQSFDNALGQCKNSERIHVINDADDTKLANLYANANAFIQVSLAEGFGMPIAEARQFGLPLLLSDIPVFHEIVDHNTIWITPEDTKSIQQGFTAVLEIHDRTSNQLLPSWKQINSRALSEFKTLI